MLFCFWPGTSHSRGGHSQGSHEQHSIEPTEGFATSSPVTSTATQSIIVANNPFDFTPHSPPQLKTDVSFKGELRDTETNTTTSPMEIPHLAPVYQKRTEGEKATCGEGECMTITSTLSDCTSRGKMFTDEANDFSLEIPQGAIPAGEVLVVDVGVALFGPFQFPPGLRPVSPLFWVCVPDNPNVQFLKPVTVTLPHFLTLENDDDIQSLGLTFLKANHDKNSEGLYEFQSIDGDKDFKTLKTHGILKALHFCFLCIATRDIPRSLDRALFCITAILPKFSIPAGKSVNTYFFITFLNLKTCLRKLNDIIATMDLDTRHQTKQLKFKFNTNTRNPALEIVITQPQHGKIGLSGNTKVIYTTLLRPIMNNKLLH